MPENSPRFNDRRQHTSPTERDAASDTSHDPRTRSVPTSSAPPSSRDARATLSTAPTTLASTRIGARRSCVCSESSETTSLVSAALSRRAHRHLASPAHGRRLDPSSSTSERQPRRGRAAAVECACWRLPSARFRRFPFWQFSIRGCPNFWGLVGVHTGPPKFAGMAIQTVSQVQGTH